MWLIPNEDEYWERVRESLEAPRKSEEPYLKEGTLFLDDDIEELEKSTVVPSRSCTRAIWRKSFWKKRVSFRNLPGTTLNLTV